MKKLFFVTLLLLALLLTSSFIEPTMGKPLFCARQCMARCSKAGVYDRCDSKCVPSGTYGNKHQCPCHRDKVNSKGKPKCPWTPSLFRTRKWNEI